MRKLFMMLLCALAVCGVPQGKGQTGQGTNQAQTPSDYVLVIDCSGSMRRELDSIVEVAKAIISRNSPDDQTMLLRFVDTPQVVEDFTSDRAMLEEALDNLYVEGGQTAIYDALEVAAQHLKQFNQNVSGRKKSIILISDGEDRDSHRTQDAIVNILKQANLRVFVIGIQGDLRGQRSRANSFIERVARETGGKAYFPKNRADFNAAAESIAQQLHQ